MGWFMRLHDYTYLFRGRKPSNCSKMCQHLLDRASRTIGTVSKERNSFSNLFSLRGSMFTLMFIHIDLKWKWYNSNHATFDTSCLYSTYVFFVASSKCWAIPHGFPTTCLNGNKIFESAVASGCLPDRPIPAWKYAMHETRAIKDQITIGSDFASFWNAVSGSGPSIPSDFFWRSECATKRAYRTLPMSFFQHELNLARKMASCCTAVLAYLPIVFREKRFTWLWCANKEGTFVFLKLVVATSTWLAQCTNAIVTALFHDVLCTLHHSPASF